MYRHRWKQRRPRINAEPNQTNEADCSRVYKINSVLCNLPNPENYDSLSRKARKITFEYLSV